jgi:hypothetical protein
VACGAEPAAPSADASGATVSHETPLPAALGGGTAAATRAASTPVTAPHALGARFEALPTEPIGAATTVPSSVDLSAHAPPPGDQGQTSSCGTWAEGYSALGWWASHLGLHDVRFAPMYLYSQIVHGDCSQGTWSSQSLAILTSQGIDTQTDYEPQQQKLDCHSQPTGAQRSNAAHFKVTGYHRADLSGGARRAIMSVLASGVPAVIGINVYPEFENASGSNFEVGPPKPGDASAGGHAITAFAYNADGLWIENSWGAGWGRDGWALLDWDFLEGSFGGQPNLAEVLAITGVELKCSDNNAQCATWAFQSQCQVNPGYMLDQCGASCADPYPHFTTSSEWYRVENVALGGGYAIDTGDIRATGNYSGQYWKLSPVGTGRYRLTTMFLGDGMSLDTDHMAASGYYSGQYWRLTPVSEIPNNQYRLTNEYMPDGMTLSVDTATLKITTAAIANDPRQYWLITPQ